ncbi:MAG: alkaline phosphatase family protein [Planctomycetota bacterium]|jgi:hypothetical protein
MEFQPCTVAAAAAARRLARTALAAGALALGACGGGPEGPRTPVLFVGIDGLEPGIVADLLERGELPHLAGLIERGSAGRLRSALPTYSPVLWTTIATGQDPVEHGVRDFLEPSTQLPYTSNTRQVPALWNLVGEQGLSADVLGWWITWPAEPIRGRVLASYAAQAQATAIWKPSLFHSMSGLSHPEELAVDLWNDLAPLLDPEQTLDALHREFPRARTVDAEAEPEQYGLNDRLVRDLGWTWSGDAGFALGAEYCLDNDPAPLVMVYQSLPDVAGHRFWRYHRPADFDYAASIPQRALEDFAEHVELSYKHSDLALGRLLERIDEDWNVIVCSDHGMHADQTMLDDPWAITSGHHRDAPDGLLVVSGPAFEHGAPRLAAGDEPLAELRELAPLVLRLLDLDVPDHWRFADELSPVFGLLDSAWSAEHPLRTARFDDAAWRRRNPRGAPEDPGSGSSAEFLERFKALGYIDADAAVDGE